MFDNPIWSTWGVFKRDIDLDKVRDYVGKIKAYGLGISQLEIDDGYGRDRMYGDLSMEWDPSSLVDDFGISLSAWVHPFVNPNSQVFEAKLDEDYFLPGKSKIEGDSVSLVRWWHDYGAVINYLDDRVASVQRQALINFTKEYGLSSLKFDAGEVTYLPKCVYIQNAEDPGEFATAYAEFAGNISQVVSLTPEVRVGYFSQKEPVWVRMLDRSSTWGLDNGLQSVLTAALTFGIAGYPFVLPDMIGGNGVSIDNDNPATPDPRLFVRWMQLNAFLPVMQFSVPPFDDSFDDVDSIDNMNVTQHALDLITLHRSLTNTMYTLSLEAKKTGYPIIRPLWWIDDSHDSMFVDDQFLIGDDIMVAPILTADSETDTRCVYFPEGTLWALQNCPGDSCRYGAGNCHEHKQCNNGCEFTVALSEFLYFKKA